MLLVVKILLVAFAVIGQSKLFPEGKAPAESELENVALPEDHPELVLARRAMAAQGLCHSPVHGGDSAATADASAPDTDSTGRDLAANCF
jgi:hypothetical protein